MGGYKKRVADMSPAERAENWRKYRIYELPKQLERARLRVQHLEREAARLGLNV